jgi:hypothetical protein
MSIVVKANLKYSALTYLNQWLANDRRFYDGLRSANRSQRLETLAKAVAFYRVSRNLPKKHDKVERYARLLGIIDGLEVGRLSFEEGLHLAGRIETRISKAYGGKRMTSLTTKVLWLRYRHPIIIYDRQARKALRAKEDLRHFSELWLREFEDRESEIDSACEDLPNVSEYCVDSKISPAQIKALSSQRWFRERVLDVYLWQVGAQL